MKDGKFKSLVRDAYKRKLIGILYGAVSTYGFSDIKDIDGFVEASNPDMLYLKSPYTGTEVDVYKWELEDYKIKNSESTIYVKLKNKPELALMF